jgi:site-specific DNA-methyltransferase (adenine-specific)
MSNYIEGDIHDVIKTLDDNSVDFIYTDPPFATTKAKWDKPLRWAELFSEMWRVLKPNGIICLYASMPFTYELLKYEKPKYHYTWIKNNSTGFLSCKYQPLRKNEEIFIYYKKRGTYNPQMVGTEFHPKRNVKYGSIENQYWGDIKKKDDIGHKGKYPTNVLHYPIRKDKTGITRTDEHIDYFIKTYTNENDTILDMTNHTKYVGSRCELLGRKYIGVDLNQV